MLGRRLGLRLRLVRHPLDDVSLDDRALVVLPELGDDPQRLPEGWPRARSSDRIDPASLVGSVDSGMLVRCTTFERLIPATDWATPAEHHDIAAVGADIVLALGQPPAKVSGHANDADQQHQDTSDHRPAPSALTCAWARRLPLPLPRGPRRDRRRRSGRPGLAQGREPAAARSRARDRPHARPAG